MIKQRSNPKERPDIKKKLITTEFDEFRHKPVVKWIAIGAVTLGALWGAKYVFRIVAANVRAVKDLIKSFKED